MNTYSRIGGLLCAMGCVAARADDPPVAPVLVGLHPAKYTMDGTYPFKGVAVVRVQPATVLLGDTIKIECEANVVGRKFYNPFLVEDQRLPAQINVVSADGKLLHSLLTSRTPNDGREAPLTVMPISETSVGRQFVVRIGGAPVPETQLPQHYRVLDLPPGEYYVQVVYNYSLLIAPPQAAKTLTQSPRAMTAGPQVERYNADVEAKGPLLISEPVKFTVAESRSDKSQTQNADHKDAPPVSAELRMLTPKVIVGRSAAVELRLVNVSNQLVDLFSPFRIGRERATSLTILSENGTLIGDLFDTSTGKAGGGWDDFPPGGLISKKFDFTAGLVWATPFWNWENMLPPGKYLLEWRIHDHLVTGRPWDLERIRRQAIALYIEERKQAGLPIQESLPEITDAERNPGTRMSLDEWKRTLPGHEICRSNRVELEILPRTGD